MNKHNIVVFTALLYLFGQIIFLELAQTFGNFDTHSMFIIILVWTSALFCGIYAHWSFVYLDKTKE